MRYVWGWLAVSMLFIFSIWIFSVKENFKAIDFDKDRLPDLGDGAPDFKSSVSSMEDFQKSLEVETAQEGFDKNDQNSGGGSISDLQNGAVSK